MQLRFEDCLLDSGTRELLRGGAAVALSPLAFRLLELLVQQRPNALSKEELNRSLWPDTYVADGNLANLVNELRTALKDDARHPRIIRTIQRYGYAFQASGESVPGPGAAGDGRCRLPSHLGRPRDRARGGREPDRARPESRRLG